MSGGEAAEKWGVFELTVPATADTGEGSIPCAWFLHADREGFATSYRAADGTYRIRFMPDREGTWSYTVRDESAEDRVLGSGQFACGPPRAGNHGPVSVDGATRFRYADGTPFHCLGTTTSMRSDGDRTVETLRTSPFTKVRVAVPAARTEEARAAALAHLDDRVRELGELGIETELILFDAEETGCFLERAGPSGWRAHIREVVSWLAARRNVWWCIASDPHDFDVPCYRWDEALQLVQEYDCARHLRSFLGRVDFDFGRPAVTHVSLRDEEVRTISTLTGDHEKPVIVDDCGREGDGMLPQESLPATELVVRVWEGVCRGGYVTHGESYTGAGCEPWSRTGGDLGGESVRRVEFLARVLADLPRQARHDPVYYDASTLAVPGQYYLQYLGPHRFRHRRFALPDGEYRVELIDTWNMTIEEAGTFGPEFTVETPGELYQAVRIRRAEPCGP